MSCKISHEAGVMISVQFTLPVVDLLKSLEQAQRKVPL